MANSASSRSECSTKCFIRNGLGAIALLLLLLVGLLMLLLLLLLFAMLETAEVVQLLKSVICVIFGCCEDEMSPAGYIGGECWELSIVCWLSSVSSSLTSLSHLSLPSRHSTVLSNSNPSLTASQLAENSLGLVRLLFSIDGLQWSPVVSSGQCSGTKCYKFYSLTSRAVCASRSRVRLILNFIFPGDGCAAAWPGEVLTPHSHPATGRD